MPFPRKEERYNDKAILTLAVDGFIDALESEVEPIPLTAEILEKNGWWQDEIDGTYHNTMSVYGRKAPFSILDGVAINYVHELQQALRLCGLKDLADNFKI